MAFVRTDLQVIGGQPGTSPTFWSYTTTDAIATVIAAGYLNDASTVLNVNDTILVASSTGGTPALTFTYVNSNTGGVVDVVNGLTIPATDGT